MNKNGKTLVLGASENPDRYSNRAINQLRVHGYDVVAIGHKIGKVADVEIGIKSIDIPNLDTVTLYLNPTNQKPYYDYIKSLKPRRVIFNPGTENEELERILAQTGVNTMEACTLVLLSTGQY
ncbi:MAG: CoA-binding protein [Bacteroidetes bacterium]|nr:CoA-binding protein [Bacteroidota bacterium]